MSQERSTLSFRSNIYPITVKGRMVNDAAFLAAITDSEALEQLWRYNGSQGRMLSARQKKLHAARVRCAYADKDDFPWGTPIGSASAICLCEKVDCPSYKQCVSRSTRGVIRKTREIGPKKESQQTIASDADRASYARQHAARVAQSLDDSDGWTRLERMRLIDRYEECMNDVQSLKSLFPGHTLNQIDYEARKLGIVEKTPYRRKRSPEVKSSPSTNTSARQGRKNHSGSRTHTNGSTRTGHDSTGNSSVRRVSIEELRKLPGCYIPGKTSSAQQSGRKEPKRQAKAQRPAISSSIPKKEKVKRKQQLAARPWEPEEDSIIRRNYPRFGSNMFPWDVKLFGRKKPAIEQRARELGLPFKPASKQK